MSGLPQCIDPAGFGELLTGKNQRDVPTLIVQRHAIRKRPSPSYPTYIDTERLVDPGAAHVERLMAKSLQHPHQLQFGALTRHSGYQTNETRHLRFLCYSSGSSVQKLIGNGP